LDLKETWLNKSTFEANNYKKKLSLNQNTAIVKVKRALARSRWAAKIMTSWLEMSFFVKKNNLATKISFNWS
jgi:hypothetical protein